MAVGRVTGGVVAALTGLAAAAIVGMAEARLIGMVHNELLVAAFMGAAAAVLWLGEKYGLIADAFTKPIVDLYGADDADEP